MKRFAKLRKVIALLIAVLLLSTAFTAQAAEEQRLNGKYVFDHADVLSKSAEEKVNEQSLKLFRKTGAEIVIITTDFLDGKDIDDYTYQKFQNMGIGSKERNNGVLLVLAVADDDYYTMVGYGIDGYFTGGKLQEMLDTYVEPYFAKGDYSKCATQFSSAMYTELKDYSYQDKYAEKSFHIGGKNAKKNSGSGGGVLSTIFAFLLRAIPVGLVIFVIARLIMKSSNNKGMVGLPQEAAFFAEKDTGSISRTESTETEKSISPPPSGEAGGSSSGGDGCGCGMGCSVFIVIAFLIFGILVVEGARIGGDSVGLAIVSVIFLFLIFGLPIIVAINKTGGGGSSSHSSSYDDSSYSSSYGSSHSSSHSPSHGSSHSSSGFSRGGSSHHSSGSGRNGSFSSGGSTRGGGAGRRK